MSAPLSLALAGTAHHQGVTPVTGTDLDSAIAARASEAPERAILLAAGVSAIARLAGRLAVSVEPPRAASNGESQPLLTPEAEILLSTLMRGEFPPELGVLIPETALPPGEPLQPEIDDDTIESLLPEAFTLIARAGRRLPPVLLPAALDLDDDQVRATLPPVLGERGRWLASQNPDWAWVRDLEAAATTQVTPVEAERLWQEGVLAERRAVLQRLRELDAEQGRLWLTQTWKSEKADTRLTLLQALRGGLSLGDESFLEAALTDRADGVRSLAAEMLAQLPDSALAGRMRGRLVGCLAPLGQTAKKRPKLMINPPEELPEEWRRDGIRAKPVNTSHGPRAWWLMQLASRVSPNLWRGRLNLEPDAVIAAAKPSEWHDALLEGWAAAAITFKDVEWLQALWNVWPQYDDTRLDLLRAMPSAMAEQIVLALLAEKSIPKGRDDDEALDLLPKPWSEQFSSAVLPLLRQIGENNMQRLLSMLDGVGTALHPAHLIFAMEPWRIPELEAERTDAKDNRAMRNREWGREAMGQFLAVVALRRLMHQVFTA